MLLVLQILIVSLLTTLFSFSVEYLLIYRTEYFKSETEKIKQLEKNLDELKIKLRQIDPKDQKRLYERTKKKKEGMQQEIKLCNQNIGMSKFWSMVLVGVTMFSVFGFLNQRYDGLAVAKLPFVPFGFLQRLSHRNLPGDDARDCSMMFFYAICSLCFKTNVNKFFGIDSSPQNMFAPQDDDDE